ncbi:MAG TPA: hypothetical protein VN653_15370, partial [Anaerolineales bacterium]|nr:hypothetical protein [Anaerolineales bacterium]
MNQSSDSLSLTPDTDWQILGELELPLNFDPNIAIETWIMDTLSPLGLNAELVRKALKSAQDSAARARQTEIRAQEFEHIHLLALASKDFSSKRS